MKNLLNALIALSWFFLIVWASYGVNHLMWYMVYFFGVVVLSGVGWIWYEIDKNSNIIK